MIKRFKLAFLFLIAGALFSGLYGSGPPAKLRTLTQPLPEGEAYPPATAGGTDSRPRGADENPPAKLRTLTQPLPEGEAYPPADAGGTDRQGSLTSSPPAKLRTLTQPLPEGEEIETLGPPATAGGSDRTEADFAAHVEQLKKKLPSERFTIVVEKPFVVIGDEPADDVREHSIRTVKWAVDRLKQEYFSKDPKDILDIWLFKDAASNDHPTRAARAGTPVTNITRRCCSGVSRRRRTAITRARTKPWS
jgi:hypothetical protein